VTGHRRENFGRRFINHREVYKSGNYNSSFDVIYPGSIKIPMFRKAGFPGGITWGNFWSTLIMWLQWRRFGTYVQGINIFWSESKVRV